MGEKPQPLDLDIEKELIKGYTGELDIYFLNEILRTKLTEIKQRIKSACEFYLRYRNLPSLLISENPEYEHSLREMMETRKEREKNGDENLDFYDEYNDWLFKLAFKDVFKGERK